MCIRDRAEAERKAAEAERLEVEAADRAASAARVRDEHRENVRQADELDPDVKHTAPTTDTAVPGGTPEAQQPADTSPHETTTAHGDTASHEESVTHPDTADGTTDPQPSGGAHRG